MLLVATFNFHFNFITQDVYFNSIFYLVKKPRLVLLNNVLLKYVYYLCDKINNFVLACVVCYPVSK